MVIRKKNVLIYKDEGVSLDTFRHTEAMLKYFFWQKDIKPINADQVISGGWQDNALMFVMPGGADLEYAKKLNGKGNENIKNYVMEGGKFLGICAGAYYASSEVEFDKGGLLEVLGKRELGLFPGKSIGPALSYYNYTSNEGASAAEVTYTAQLMKMDLNYKFKLYHHGGGFFENAEFLPNVKVLLNYVTENATKLAAIVKIGIGKGQALLSGVHFEIDPKLLTHYDDPYLQSIIPELEKSEWNRETMLRLHFFDHRFLALDNEL